MPRATTAAWEVMPPRAVRMPAASSMPFRSSGEVSMRTRIARWFFSLSIFFGIFGEEHHRTGRCARRCGQSLYDDFGVFFIAVLSKTGWSSSSSLAGSQRSTAVFFVDQAFAQHVHGDLHHRGARTLAVATLEHPEFAVLDREFDVLHILEILLQVVLYLVEFFIYGRHHLLERGVFAATLGFRYVLVPWPSGANPRW